MKRSFGCTAIILLLSLILSAQDSINLYTGTYRSVADSGFYFNIKANNQRLILELPGQGETTLQPQGNRRFVPELVQPATTVIFSAGADSPMQFQWLQDMQAELVKLSDSSHSTGYAGSYQLKNNPYVTLTITSQQQDLIVKQGSSEPILMHPVGKDEFAYEKDGLRLHYSFTRAATGAVQQIRLTRTGPQLFVRQPREATPPYAGRSFLQRSDFTRADSLQGYLYPERSCYDVLFYSLVVRVMPESKSVSGRNTIRFKALRSFQRMQIDLFQSMAIETLLYHNQPLKYTREYNAVFIHLPQTIAAGTVDSITIAYAGQPRMPDGSNGRAGFSGCATKTATH